MASDELCWLSATDLAALIRRRKVSPVEVVDAVLERIERLNPQLNAYVTVTADEARRAAKLAEREAGRRGAALGPLHGVPFSVKDLVITKGVRTTFGTPLYADNVPTEDAPMVARLKAAGGIMVGKTNTPALGWLGATHNLLFGATREPVAPRPHPGRIERRRLRGGRGGPRADRDRDGWRRLASASRRRSRASSATSPRTGASPRIPRARCGACHTSAR